MFFEHDVQQVHNDLLRAITNMQSTPSDKRINLSDDRARIDQITLDRHLLHEPDDIRNVDLQLEMAGIVSLGSIGFYLLTQEGYR